MEPNRVNASSFVKGGDIYFCQSEGKKACIIMKPNRVDFRLANRSFWHIFLRSDILQ
jgi:uncharacterized pyridoxamine 5'-phosphate oxidase family protein